MEIIPMNENHIHPIAELEKVCFSDPWSVNAMAYELKNPLSTWFVAVDGDTVAGYVGSQTVLGEADMMNLAVNPQYRRRGIGQALVEKLIDDLRSKDAYCLTLEVRVSNDSAIALYEKMGFVVVGRRPNYYHQPKEDALIMRKEWTL